MIGNLTIRVPTRTCKSKEAPPAGPRHGGRRIALHVGVTGRRVSVVRLTATAVAPLP